MEPTTTYWETTKPPHRASLPNLRKISEFMMREGYTSRMNTVSARQIHLSTGITYTQVLSLIRRPGFVGVVDGSTNRWFYLPEFGFEYPETVPPMGKIPRYITVNPPQVIIAQTHGNPIEDKVAKAVAKIRDPNEIYFIPDLTRDSGEVNNQQLTNTFAAMIQAIQSGAKTPTEMAKRSYEIFEALQSGRVTINDA